MKLKFANEECDSDRWIEISDKQNLTSKQIAQAIDFEEAMKNFLDNDTDSGSSFYVVQRRSIEYVFDVDKKLFSKHWTHF